MDKIFKDVLGTELEPLIDISHKYYDLGNEYRHYHNLQHAISVVRALWAINPNAAPAEIIAALWHDAVYIPGSGNDSNERCSAAALGVEYRNLLTEYDYSDVIVSATSLICSTSIEFHLTDQKLFGSTAILLDADLHALALPYDVFLENQVNIIHENGGTVPESNKQSAEFLSKFLTVRDCIYHTYQARSLWEDKARANIRRYCKENNVEIT